MKWPFSKKHNDTGTGSKMIPRSNLVHEVYSDPFLDWVLILSLSLVTALALVAVGVSMYLDTGRRLSAPSATTPGTNKSAIDARLLESVLSGYEARAKERSDIIRGHSVPRDPSLP